MNYSDVFRKSDLGREEIQSQSLGILPREARTLLIMIDGKRDYRSYLETLDNSKMFASFGGVTPLFELLLELEYIELVGVAPTATRAEISSQMPVAPSVVPESRPISQSTDTNIETDFERTFNNNSNKITTSGKSAIGNIFRNKLFKANDETIKSDLATYIEKNAPPVEAWSYLLMLEQCENNSQLSILVQEIQNTSSENLARGMNEFIRRVQH
ncbi:hypothetical protein [Psychrobacter aquaticus]|uniref:Uncharacterized protein n=1 Tax=Psychrobacter aquaticus CMS 56 TaxID=1354303 RepID=U4TDD1_9GAMM|nr:hypothetical protein [Psychrobacter aquaticus]ERL56739.1 hypothetical protein M917_0369 [Psychrobacter aquaticus CMS 56]